MPFSLGLDDLWRTPGIFGQFPMPTGNVGAPGITPPTGSWADKLVQKLGSPGAQIGLRILANNRGGASLGNVLGQSALQYQQDQAQMGDTDLRRKLMEAQIAKLQQPEQQQESAPVIVVGPDGKPRYASRRDALGQQPYQDPTQNPSQAGSIQEYEQAMKTGFKGSYLEFLKNRTQMTTPAPQEPLVAIQTADGRSIYVPRSQAVGATPGAPKENPVPQEGERTSANYFGRMQAAEGLLGNYQPSLMDYIAAGKMMSGGTAAGSLANMALSPQGQQYYQAASDWVRAKLRKESGAVISPGEMAQEIKQYFPVPGDSQETIAQKARSRQQAMSGMREMGGRAVTQNASSPAPALPGVDAIAAELARRAGK